ncbi:MAG: hypothetical protein AAF945_21485, partial [Actinomycetota bacterium]
ATGPGSLVEAIGAAAATPAPDTITFAVGVQGEIDLTGVPPIDYDSGGSLRIVGPGADRLTVRSFELNAEPTSGIHPEIEVSGLALVGGEYALRAAGVKTVRLADLRISGTTGFGCAVALGDAQGRTVFEAEIAHASIESGSCAVSADLDETITLRDVDIDGNSGEVGVHLRRGRRAFVCDARIVNAEAGIDVDAGFIVSVAVARTTLAGNVRGIDATPAPGAFERVAAVSVIDSDLVDNVVGLELGNSSSWVHGSRLRDNRTAIRSANGSVRSISQSTLEGGEWAIVGDSRFVTIDASAISGVGRPIDVEAEVSLTRSVITGSGASPGLLMAVEGSAEIRGSTIVDNLAGDAPLIQMRNGAPLSIASSIIVADDPGGLVVDTDDGSATSQGSYLSDDAWLQPDDTFSQGNVIGSDPRLVPTSVGDRLSLEPAVGSPVIDMLAGPAVGGIDMRGNPRTAGVAADPGAIEFDPGLISDMPIVPIDQVRVLDSRDLGSDLGGGCGVTEGRSVRVPVAGIGRVPVDAAAVLVNLVAVRPIGTGFATVHRCDAEPPNAASVNYAAGTNVANEVFVDLDGDVAFCVFTSTTAEFVADVVGFVPAGGADLVTEPGRRLLDTRPGGSTVDDVGGGIGPVGAGDVVEVQVAGRGEVPLGSTTVVAYVTSVQPVGPGFVTAWPCDAPRPTASVLNVVAGVNRGNEIVAGLGASGRLCLVASVAMHFTLDVSGWGTAVDGLTSVVPERLLDTRVAVGPITDVEIDVTSSESVPSGVAGVIVNLTVIRPAATGFLSATDCDGGEGTSSLNFEPGVNVANELLVPVSGSGTICITSSTPVDLAVDLAAHLTP